MASISDRNIYYVYWIKTKEMTDMTQEGYIGISYCPEDRWKAHIKNCKYMNKNHGRMKKSVNSGEAYMEILVCSDRDYCKNLERKLRPNKNIGWNFAIGGDVTILFKHGLHGEKIYKVWQGLLRKSRIRDEFFYPDWLGPEGLLRFKTFHDRYENVEGQWTLDVKGEGYTPTNLVKRTKKEIESKKHRELIFYDIGDGYSYSLKDLAKKFNIKASTITSRLHYGWTLRESLEIDPHKRNKRKNRVSI